MTFLKQRCRNKSGQPSSGDQRSSVVSKKIIKLSKLEQLPDAVIYQSMNGCEKVKCDVEDCGGTKKSQTGVRPSAITIRNTSTTRADGLSSSSKKSASSTSGVSMDSLER